MPVLRNGRMSEDGHWPRLGDDDPLPDAPAAAADGTRPALPVAVGLARFLDGAAADGVAGVWLRPEDDALALAPWLDRLRMVAIEFPTFTDGRGYSQARQLRGRLGFVGEIRAVGDVRPDQVLFMMRAGIDAFEFVSAPDPTLLQQVLSRYRSSYQPSYTLPIAG